ncbi:hypothetical protein [Catenovulum adriaticum]|uniref:Lipoprotein n=1 Tax=Catenovulum adriaticum TaxID=2984846 RepID=A0ABY7ANG8_9ALTE|nr:hypothetical protein [Catenovulum sp. TS8]WAJ70845.1 hypothetical protein OLW01_03275 [Catenovulum sp. TS8]
MKLTFKHTALSLALAGSFALTGCNFIGDGDAVFTDPTMTVAFDGAAIKGPLAGATVSAYLKSDTNRSNDLLADQDIQTDANGEYDFTLDVSGDVVIVVTADSDTTMVCDAPSGCGSVAYEDEVQATDLTGVSLSSVAYVSSGQSVSSTPVNTLTTLAAEIAKDVPNATKAQLQKIVLDLVGLTEEEQDGIDIFSLKLVDGTDVASQSNAVVKKLSAFNAALARVDTNSGETTLSNKLTAMANSVKAVAAANKDNIAELQALLDEVASYVKTAQEEAQELDEDLEYEDPAIELEDGGELTSTGTGTGTGSGSNSGGIN